MIVLYSTARVVWRDSSTFYIYNMFIHTNIPAKTNQQIINPFPVISPATPNSSLSSSRQRNSHAHSQLEQKNNPRLSLKTHLTLVNVPPKS